MTCFMLVTGFSSDFDSPFLKKLLVYFFKEDSVVKLLLTAGLQITGFPNYCSFNDGVLHSNFR